MKSDQNKRYYEKNKDRIKSKRKEYYRKNKEKCRLSSQKYRQLNPEKHRESYLKWRMANPHLAVEASTKWNKNNTERYKFNQSGWRVNNVGKRNAIAASRRARLLMATPRWISEAQKKSIESMYVKARGLSVTSGIPHEVDHIYPLQGKTCCGLHLPWNLKIVSRSYNRAKRNRMPCII